MTQTALILGASGRFGSHCDTAFRAAGWTTRRYTRGTDMAKAAQGVDVIVNGLNPPNYKNWATEIPRITQQVIAAAKASGATVLVPGNVYTFGTQPGPWSDSTPQTPCSRKGAIRVTMENAYRAAACDGVRTILLRGGDYIDTRGSGGFFDLVITKPLAKGRISYPGRTDIPHAWAYLPDMARAAVALADARADLPAFADIAFPGWTLSGADLADQIAHVAGRSIVARRMSWVPIQLASPFWGLGRELLEMRYLWDHPHWLDGTRFADVVPEFAPTPMAAALASALPADVHPDKAVIAADRLARAD